MYLCRTIANIDDNTTGFTFTNGSLEVVIRNGDLSQEPCDVIVNPTNEKMEPNGGLDSHIHSHMGQFFTDQVVAIHKEMQDNSCPVGQSRIFIAKFNPDENQARFVINTVGPTYSEAEQERAAFLLQSCYCTSLALANLYQLSSIAYPAISCGVKHYPPNEAVRVAIESIRQFAFNVKHVRFVLFDRGVYDIFVQEWTDYAQRVNKEANITDQTSDYASEPPKKTNIPPPVPPKPSARYCVLCKERQLPIDRQLLCLVCSELTRPEIFIKFLSNLRAAGDKSYDDLVNECQLLKPILKSYPLVYTPAQIFDQSIHKRDPVAEHYLQQHCDKNYRNFMPMAVAGDGNCFYNTFVKLGGVGTTTDASTLTPVELRARNVVELVLNIDAYEAQYGHFSSLLDKFQDYATTEMVRDTNYTAVWDLLSIPTVLDINMISVYPKVNGTEDKLCQFLNNALFIPVSNEDNMDDQEKKTEALAVNKEIRLLFSHCNRPIIGFSKKKQEWTPNHFVPLLNFR
jgi:O-acetyl-ADP-ribose deacetylase (regulator of RNase III)